MDELNRRASDMKLIHEIATEILDNKHKITNMVVALEVDRGDGTLFYKGLTVGGFASSLGLHELGKDMLIKKDGGTTSLYDIK